MERYLLAVWIGAIFASNLGAQDSASASASSKLKLQNHRTWFTKHDAIGAGIAAAAIGVLLLVDEPVARASQRRSLQDNSFLHNSTKLIQSAGDPGAILLSTGLYVTGKLTHRGGLSDASKHAVMSIVVSSAFTQTIKLSAGRARPSITNDQNAFVFHLFHGAKTDYNSLPSGHTTAAFAAAGAFSSEISRSHPRAARIARPLLYGVASLVGGSRLYNNRHWLSDVVTGALIGEVTARRVVKLSHGER